MLERNGSDDILLLKIKLWYDIENILRLWNNLNNVIESRSYRPYEFVHTVYMYLAAMFDVYFETINTWSKIFLLTVNKIMLLWNQNKFENFWYYFHMLIYPTDSQERLD